MPPKKTTAPPKKKKDGGPESGGELEPEEKAKLYMYTCNALQVQLAERTEDATKSHLEMLEMKRQLEEMTKKYNEQKNDGLDLTQDMTRQYKGMQEELLSRIRQLEETIIKLKDTLSQADARVEQVVKEKDVVIRQKEEEISELKIRMEDMAEEFNQMLKDTLERMRERIDVSTGHDANSDNVASLQKTMNNLTYGRK